MTKTCTACGETQPLTNFTRHASTKDGRHTKCNACRRQGVPSARMANHATLRAEGKRQCARCEAIFDLIEFGRYKNGGLNPACKACVAARKRGRYTPAERRAHTLWYHYRLTVDEYNAMLAAQGGGCAICGVTEPPGKGQFAVDHDHRCCPGLGSCGACVRGLLCTRCNPMIGFARESPTILQAAADYLARRGEFVTD